MKKLLNFEVPRARMLLTILCLLFVGIGQMWGWNAGVNDTDGAGVDLTLDGKSDFTMTVSKDGISNYSTQTVRSSLLLKSAHIKTWKNKSNGNVCHMYLNYCIYKSGDPNRDWNSIELSSVRQIADENNQIKQEWSTSINLELAQKNSTGTYYFEYYFNGEGKHNGTSGCGDWSNLTYNNNGGNYRIPFTIGYATNWTIEGNNNQFLFQYGSATNIYAWTDGGGSNAGWPGRAISAYNKCIGGYYIYTDGGYNKFIANGNSKQTSDLSISEWKNKIAYINCDGVYQTYQPNPPLNISYNKYEVIWGEAVDLNISWNNSANVSSGTYEISVTGATIKSGGSGTISGTTGSATCMIQLPPSGDDGDYISVTITYVVEGITITIPSAIYVINPITLKVKDEVGFGNIYLKMTKPNGSDWDTWPGVKQERLGGSWYLVRLNPTLNKFWLNNGSSNKQTYSEGMDISNFNNGEIRALALGTDPNQTPYQKCWLRSHDASLGVALYRVKTFDGTNTYYSNAVSSVDDVMSFYADVNSGSATYKIESMAANATSWSEGSSITKSVLTAKYTATSGKPGAVFTAKLNAVTPTGITDVAVYEGDYLISCGATTANYLTNGASNSGTTGTKFIYFEPNTSIFGTEAYNYYWVDWFPTSQTVVASVGNEYNDNLTHIIGNDAYAPNGVAITYGGSGSQYEGGNVRFGYNPNTNYFSRTIIAGSGSKINIQGARVDPDKDGSYGESASFSDASSWVYTIDANVKSKAIATTTTTYNDVAQTLANNQQLIGGDEEDDDTEYHVVITYDYKTNRLLAAWVPSGAIEGFELESNLMVVRQENGTPTVLNITTPSTDLTKITKIYTALELLQDNWKKSGGNADRRIDAGSWCDEYYWISLPYECKIKDIFGIEGYGDSWIIQTYHGDYRARDGWWAETDSWWYDMDRDGVMNANQGYVVRFTNLNGDHGGTKRFAGTSGGKLYLYFPSSNDANISIGRLGDSETTTATEHECTIWRGKEKGEHEGDPNYDRRAIDSNWNIIGSPSFNDAKITDSGWGTGTYPTSDITGTLKYFFTWAISAGTPTYTVQNAQGYQFHATHAYLAQYAGDIHWAPYTNNSTDPLVGMKAPARHNKETGNQTLKLMLMRYNVQADVAFISRMTEGATEGYDLNMDLSKLMNKSGNNIYTIAGYYKMAGNCLPDTVKTIPVGVKIATEGDYTFSMPDGTNGTGVTLVDNVTGEQTNLALTDYTVNLPAGETNDRFTLVLSPIAQTPTGVDEIVSDQQSAIRKVMVDGVLYIVKDGEVFDARGNRVK